MDSELDRTYSPFERNEEFEQFLDSLEEETDEDDTHERKANKCGVLNVVSIWRSTAQIGIPSIETSTGLAMKYPAQYHKPMEDMDDITTAA